ncbi:MAG: Lrp/AsnC ligand binding domain-containing protein [Gammaproteobacteria bacterium]|nr:Lrp/AsnC ligand binding domain-containing protein [Gammaproteobacteria bacterium]
MAEKIINKISLDRIDKRILKEIQNNGRVSYVELGKLVGLSTSPCLERVHRLEKHNYIKSYTANLNPELLGAGLLIFVEINLTYRKADVFDEFKKAVEKWPQIQECHLVSGDFDYLLKIRIENIAIYRQLLGDILHTLPDVRESRTMVVMETASETSKIDIA